MKTGILLLLLSISTFGYSQSAEKSIEKQQLTWGGKAAVGGYAPEGTLDVKSIALTYTSEKITALKIVVDMTSLYQENEQLAGHLIQKDFFHVKKYPTAVFEITEASSIVDGNVTLIGKMTIKGVSLKEEIAAWIKISNGFITLEFDHTMDRTRYGITYNSPSVFEKLKENAIADKFTLKGCLVYAKI